MNIWKGAILGLSKHRDFEHGTFYEHLVDNEGIIGFRTKEAEEFLEVIDYDPDDLEEEIEEELRYEAAKLLEYWMKINPITGLRFENEHLYYALVITLSKKQYDYFIPAPESELPPDPKLISATIDEYMENHGNDRAELLAEHIMQEG